jgi:hypothetical protein
LFPSPARGALGIAPGFVWGELLHGEATDTRGYITIFNYQTAISLTWQPNHHPPLLSSHSREKEKEEEKK